MRPLAEAAIEAGLIDPEAFAQFKRWGFVPKDMELGTAGNPEEVVESIQEALDAEEQVRLQATDLDVLQYYSDKMNHIKGQMVLVGDDGERATKTVTFAVRTMLSKEQFILPWLSEDILELLTNGRSYLRWRVGSNGRRVYMTDADELYFGDVKMFMLCTGTEEPDGSD